MKKVFLACMFSLLVAGSAFAQTRGDYLEVRVKTTSATDTLIENAIVQSVKVAVAGDPVLIEAPYCSTCFGFILSPMSAETDINKEAGAVIGVTVVFFSTERPAPYYIASGVYITAPSQKDVTWIAEQIVTDAKKAIAEFADRMVAQTQKKQG